MKTFKEAMKHELGELQRLKDELKLQAHLGKREAQTALERLEAAWPELEAKLGAHAGDAVEHAAHALRTALRDADAALARIVGAPTTPKAQPPAPKT